MDKKFVIIDGPALLHRAWHALPPLSNKKGELLNAVYGFVLVFLRVLKELKPDYLAVAFDRKEPTFRHKEYKEYKAQRVKQPDEFYRQIPRVKELLNVFNVSVFEKAGFEADDIIGTLDKKAEGKNLNNVIVTGDLDVLQLVSDKTKVYTLKKGIADIVVYDSKTVEERYGLKPEQMVDFKALRGDPSDNIPGIKGIGEKTAIKLLKTFGSLENIYRSLEDDLENFKFPDKVKNLLLEQKRNSFLSKKLVVIIKNVPIEVEIEKCAFKNFNKEKVVKLFQELEFKSLLPKVLEMNESASKNNPNQSPLKEQRSYYLIDEEEKFNNFIKKLEEQKLFVIDTETNGLNPFQAKLLGISFCWEEKEAYFVKFPISDSQFQSLKNILENPEIKKIGHNIKFDIKILRENGIKLAGVDFDTMIASYLLNPGSRAHDLDTLIFNEFGCQKISLDDLVGKKNALSLELIPLEKLSVYSCEDADYTFRLMKKLEGYLERDKLMNVFKKIEIPLIPVLAEIERSGVKIDLNLLKNLSKEIKDKIKGVEDNIYQLAGPRFNINSPKQLKEILFDKLKIASSDIRKIKTGFSTAASELEKLKGKHPIINLISEYRELIKIESTYIDALPRLIEPKTGRVHTNFNQAVTATGRLSSSDPNLQNIPIRTDLGNKIRKAFISEKGRKIVSVDYSQIELRVIASLSNDERMIESFNKGEDIHTRTAAEIYGRLLEEVTPEMRRDAKTVNFGIQYGIGAKGLSESVGISLEEAENFIKEYFKIYAGVKRYIEETIALARNLGYVETLFGRRRYLPEIVSNVDQIRKAAERMAINMPIQGLSSDLMKLAMIEIYSKIISGNEAVKMILQIHDELLFEIREEKVGEISEKIRDIMENIIKLKAPIAAEVKVGDNWGELKKLNLN